jgi:hypothetical protein
MKVKVFTAKGWDEIGKLEERVNSFVDGQMPPLRMTETRTELAATTDDGKPAVVAMIWYP